jgi:branched-chain amino acid transport system permease protein
MLESLGHNVPRLWMLVFAAGSGLAGLAGVIGGSTFVTEPAMAATVGSVIFVVVVVGGLGSLMGAFWVSLALGLLQTLAVSFDHSLGFGVSLAQLAPVLPYALMVLVLVLRPQGLFGAKDR